MAKLIYCTSDSVISKREIEFLLYFLSYHHQFVYYFTPSAVTFLTFRMSKNDICHYLIGKHVSLPLTFSLFLFGFFCLGFYFVVVGFLVVFFF